MITASMYTVIEFDSEGKERIYAAAMTILNVVDVLRKVGGSTSAIEEELEGAATVLESILEGERW